MAAKFIVEFAVVEAKSKQNVEWALSIVLKILLAVVVVVKTSKQKVERPLTIVQNICLSVVVIAAVVVGEAEIKTKKDFNIALVYLII